MKGKVVKAPALPCVFITNKLEKYNDLANSGLFDECTFWNLDRPIYAKGTIKRSKPEFITSADVDRAIQEAKNEGRIPASASQATGMPSASQATGMTIEERLPALAEFKKLSDRVNVLTEENSSFQE